MRPVCVCNMYSMLSIGFRKFSGFEGNSSFGKSAHTVSISFAAFHCRNVCHMKRHMKHHMKRHILGRSILLSSLMLFETLAPFHLNS